MRICILNHVSPSFNPRMVKEADALADAGHDVRVVSVRNSVLSNDDRRLLSQRKWRYTCVSYSRRHLTGFTRWVTSGASARASRSLSRLSTHQRLAEAAFCRYGRGQMGLALSEPTDLYIAHNLQNLPIAAKAASLTGAMLGFDMEDYHIDEDSPSSRDPVRQRFKEQILSTYLPRCRHLSVTSEAMADVVEQRFGIARPLVLYNAFPLAYANFIEPPAIGADAGKGYTAYWFSQVVGMDRGLQDFIRALPRLSRRIELHIRGKASPVVRKQLLDLAGSLDAGDLIYFHDPIYSEDLVRDAAQYDFGLALEQAINRNRLITVTNKLFTYMLAGIVPVATDTEGQREVVEQAGNCGIMFAPGNVDELILKMNALLSAPDRILTAKRSAWQAARSRFCWDIEQVKLVSAIARIDQGAATKAPRHARAAVSAQRQEFDVPILMYHDILADDEPGVSSSFCLPFSSFLRQIDFLHTHGYETITLGELLRLTSKGSRCSPNQVVITFDDGYKSFAKLVTPLLAERGMTATAFIVVSQIGGSNTWDYHLDATPRRPLMDEQDIRAAIEGGFEIGIHGWAHRDLNACTPEEMDEEISRSRSHMQQTFGLMADTFAYPYGKYSSEHFDVLRAAGYSGAVSIFSSESYVTSNPFAMRRIYVHSGDSLGRFRIKMSPLYLRYKAARKTPIAVKASTVHFAAKAQNSGAR